MTRVSAPHAIVANGLRKTYGETVALAEASFDVPRATVCALLGPNGAGKTTTVRLLTTLAVPDAGSATVAGLDVVTHPVEVRRRIGLAAQDATVDGLLTGRENLAMIGRLHALDRRAARVRADELLEQFSLTDAANRLVKTYSGGMRRRLDLAATLVSHPEVLFLDEPTTGLDPRSRNDLWAVLETLVDAGTTILLTTQYMEEADRLADDIVVIDHGRVIARGDAAALKGQVGGSQVVIVVKSRHDLPEAERILTSVTGTDAEVDPTALAVRSSSAGGTEILARVAEAIGRSGLEVDDLGIRRPTMDEVFLTLTGHGIDAAEEA